MPSSTGLHMVLGAIGAVLNLIGLIAPEPYKTIALGLVGVLTGISMLAVGHAATLATTSSALTATTGQALLIKFPPQTKASEEIAAQVSQPGPSEDQEGRP